MRFNFIASKIDENQIRKKIEDLKIKNVNIDEILKELKETVKDLDDVEVEIRIMVSENGYNILIETPSVGELVKKELKVEKLKISEEDKAKGITSVGDLKFEQVVKIAKIKRHEIFAKDFKKVVKQIVSACLSMPITIEGKNPKEILKEIDEGKWDSFLNV